MSLLTFLADLFPATFTPPPMMPDHPGALVDQAVTLMEQDMSLSGAVFNIDTVWSPLNFPGQRGRFEFNLAGAMLRFWAGTDTDTGETGFQYLHRDDQLKLEALNMFGQGRVRAGLRVLTTMESVASSAIRRMLSATPGYDPNDWPWNVRLRACQDHPERYSQEVKNLGAYLRQFPFITDPDWSAMDERSEERISVRARLGYPAPG